MVPPFARLSPNAALDRYRRWPRAWRLLLRGLLIAYLLYLLLGNVFLNTPLFDLATNRTPEKFRMHTGPALTVLPGFVTAWDLRMRGHVQRNVWTLRADRASARIALLPLLRREVRLPWMEAVNVIGAIDRVADAIPPPPQSDQGWTLRFDAIHSGTLRRARFGDLAIEGKGHGTVGFLKQLKGGPVQLFPSQIVFDDASVRYGKRQIADQAHVDARFSFPRHYRAQAPGLRKLGIADLALQLHGRGVALRIDTAGAQTRLSTEPGLGHVQANLRLLRGELQPGSKLNWRVPLHAGVGATDRGVLALLLDVDRDIRLRARLPGQIDPRSMLDADLRIGGRTLPFDDPGALLPRLSGALQGRWHFESLNWISDLLVRKPWFRLDGGGDVSADLRLAQGALQPGSRLDVPEVQATADVLRVRIRGKAQAAGRIVGTAAQPRTEVAVRMHSFALAPLADPKAIFVQGENLRLDLDGAGTLATMHDSLQARLRFDDARVPDLRAYNRYLPATQVRVLGGSGSLSGDLHLDAAGQVGEGNVRVRGRQARLQAAGLALAGDLDLDARLRRAELHDKRFDLSGSTLRVQGVRYGDGGKQRDWWATLRVPQGRIAAAPATQADAQVQMQMRDAGPVLAVFAQRSDAPAWLLKLVDAGQLDARGQLRWSKDALWLDRLHAENQRVSLRARLRVGDAGTQGDLYARWGVLGVGVALRGEQRQWHLLNAREWYERQPAWLPEPP
ncbi:translocation/assembly module TamB domain-containing protein, partial [Xanthomonas graminis]